MMSRTHVAVGIAAAIACVRPETAADCAAAVLLGGGGAKLCDVDMLWNKKPREVATTLLTAAVMAVCLVVLDALSGAGICLRLLTMLGERWRAGAVLLAVLCVSGYFAEHRSFTHSLLAMTAFTAAVWMILPAYAVAFAAGYGSHLVLDLLNRKPLRLMFPFKGGYCLKLCSADGFVNGLLMWLGTAAAVCQLIWPIIRRVIDT